MKNHIHTLSRAVVIDDEHILLCKTLDLTPEFYFLPGGHIEHEESAEEAVTRELLEETGAKVEIIRFFGLLEHIFTPGHNSICHNHEYNLFFEASSDSLKRHIPIPRQEDHIELVWMPLAQIQNIDIRPEKLKSLIAEWTSAPVNNIFQSQRLIDIKTYV